MHREPPPVPYSCEFEGASALRGLCRVDSGGSASSQRSGHSRVEEALHKRALWGVPRALREWDVIEVIEVCSITDNRQPNANQPTTSRVPPLLCSRNPPEVCVIGLLLLL